jgi:hypothetical protein
LYTQVPSVLQTHIQLWSLQAFKEQQERITLAAARTARYNPPYPISDAISHILTAHPLLSSPVTAATAPGVALSAALVRTLGRSHSASAAVAAFEWLRGRSGERLEVAVYEAAVAACAMTFAVRDALHVYKQAEDDGVDVGPRLLNMLLASCCHAGHLDVAIEVRRTARPTCRASPCSTRQHASSGRPASARWCVACAPLCCRRMMRALHCFWKQDTMSPEILGHGMYTDCHKQAVKAHNCKPASEAERMGK